MPDFYRISFFGVHRSGLAVVCADSADEAIELAQAELRKLHPAWDLECKAAGVIVQLLPVPGPCVLYLDPGIS